MLSQPRMSKVDHTLTTRGHNLLIIYILRINLSRRVGPSLVFMEQRMLLSILRYQWHSAFGSQFISSTREDDSVNRV